MPNLLSLNNYHYPRGGSDVVYFEHASMFEDEGWSNTFFSMKHPRNLSCKDEGYFTDTVDWEFASGALDKTRSALASVYNLDARRKLRRLIAERSPDIAHAHCIYHHLTPAVLPVLAGAGIPIVLTAHDLKLACPAYKMMNSDGICEKCRVGGRWNVVANRCIKDSFAASAVVGVEAYVHGLLGSYRKHLTRIVAPSLFYRDKLIEWGWEPARIVYIPNFVPPPDTRFVGDYSGAILYFGRLSSEKGLETLVKAAAASGVAIDIAGIGPQMQQLHELARLIDAPVRFLGRLDGDRLWTTVGKARAVVLPSEWYENAPMSALEAMQLKRPILAADIGGIPELIRPSGAGVLYPSGNLHALAAALGDLAALPQTRLAEIGQAAAAYADKEFSRKLYFQRMQELYKQCLDGASKR